MCLYRIAIFVQVWTWRAHSIVQQELLPAEQQLVVLLANADHIVVPVCVVGRHIGPPALSDAYNIFQSLHNRIAEIQRKVVRIVVAFGMVGLVGGSLDVVAISGQGQGAKVYEGTGRRRMYGTWLRRGFIVANRGRRMDET